tara:strand:- start:213 stop:374 length:162 start_codon:yes stop_codon:yes gene_type:complete
MVYGSDGAFDFTSIYNMPVFLKRFYLNLLIEQKTKEDEQMKKHQAKINKTGPR